MPTQTLALDLSRLFLGGLRPAPRGIDRVELAYARHFLAAWPGACFALLPTPWGVRLFEREQALRGVAAVEALWGETAQPGQDVLAPVRRWLEGLDGEVGAPARGRWRRGAPKLGRMGVSLGRPVSALPSGALYLNVGHVGLSCAPCLDWLKRRPDVRLVFMLHDLIPVEHPAYVSADEGRYFQRIVANLPLARGLILNSHTVADAVDRLLPPLESRRLVSHLPISVSASPVRPAVGGRPYFVACGQMEQRKNHLMLAQVWEMMNRDGPPPVRLVLVGAPADASPGLDKALDRWDPRRRHVLQVGGLSTPGLFELLRGSVALLAPSLAEGFGLPVAEALSLGIPVLASDIPAHREVADDHAIYLDSLDPDAWLALIAKLTAEPAAVTALVAKAESYEPRTTEAYFAEIEAFLHQVAA